MPRLYRVTEHRYPPGSGWVLLCLWFFCMPLFPRCPLNVWFLCCVEWLPGLMASQPVRGAMFCPGLPRSSPHPPRVPPPTPSAPHHPRSFPVDVASHHHPQAAKSQPKWDGCENEKLMYARLRPLQGSVIPVKAVNPSKWVMTRTKVFVLFLNRFVS